MPCGGDVARLVVLGDPCDENSPFFFVVGRNGCHVDFRLTTKIPDVRRCGDAAISPNETQTAGFLKQHISTPTLLDSL